MALWEFITSLVSAAVGAIAGGIFKLFTGRKRAAKTQIVHTQTIVVVAPLTLLRHEVALTDRVRDLLEIASGTAIALSKPKLIVPGEGLVNPKTFIEYAVEELLITAIDPVRCESCNKARKHGAYVNGRWLCLGCFQTSLQDVTLGSHGLFAVPSPSGSDWEHVEGLLKASAGYQALSNDAFLLDLFGHEVPVAPRGRFVKIWFDHNTDGTLGRGMRIHCDLVVDNLSGASCEMIAFFAYASGGRLLDLNGQFRSSDGYAAAGVGFVPPSVVTRYEDLSVYMPYAELHLTCLGTFSLAFYLGLYSHRAKVYFAFSDWNLFSIRIA